MLTPEQIKQRLDKINSRIRAACAAANRSSERVALIAVSKRFAVDAVVSALAAGQVDFGENYVGELAEKAQYNFCTPPRWHVIGPVQRRSVNQIPANVALIHTLDRIALLERFARVWPGTMPRFLVQVNIGHEAQKAGVLPEALDPFLVTVRDRFPDVEIRGLMAIPPVVPTPEAGRPYFAEMRALAAQLEKRGLLPGDCELSMGMSDDFEIAIAEGATMVRIGSAIFGTRD